MSCFTASAFKTGRASGVADHRQGSRRTTGSSRPFRSPLFVRVVALQLKRIGDLALTTPALHALKSAGAQVTLVVMDGAAALLPMLDGEVGATLVYHSRGRQRRAVATNLARRIRRVRGLHRARPLRAADARLAGGNAHHRAPLVAPGPLAAALLQRRRGGARALPSHGRSLPGSPRAAAFSPPPRAAGRSPRRTHPAPPARPRSRELSKHSLPTASARPRNSSLRIRAARGRKNTGCPSVWAEVIAFCRQALGRRCVLTGGSGDPVEDQHLARLRRVAGRARPEVHRPRRKAGPHYPARRCWRAPVCSSGWIPARCTSPPRGAARKLSSSARPILSIWRPRHAGCRVLHAGHGDLPVRRIRRAQPGRPARPDLDASAVINCITETMTRRTMTAEPSL